MPRGCIRVTIAFAASLLAANCASIPNKPLNQPASTTQSNNPVQPAIRFSNNPAPIPPQNRPGNDRSNLRADDKMAYDTDLVDDPIYIGLTFSGGGTRAAAFGYGIIKEFEATQIHVSGNLPPSLFDHIDILSGVSGGSVLAAYIGLKGRAGLDDFRERFLLRDAEESINTHMGLDTLGAAVTGGINDQTKLPRWLTTIYSTARPCATWNVSGRSTFIFMPRTCITGIHSCFRGRPSTRSAATTTSIRSQLPWRLRPRYRSFSRPRVADVSGPLPYDVAPLDRSCDQ